MSGTTIIQNCYFEMRTDQVVSMFTFDLNDNLTVHMDGYAVIPMDKYKEMKRLANKSKGLSIPLVDM